MKSPPELWAELSELESLARHLGEFGEIRITKVDPESRVEWEADRASGTVRLEPSGWGTRVVLTVDTPQPEVVPPEPVAAEPEPVAAEPAAQPPAVDPEPEPVTPEPQIEPVAAEPEPEPEPPVKRGWFARLFRRTPREAPPAAPAPSRSPSVAEAARAAQAEALAAAEPVDAAPEEPVVEEPAPIPPDRAFGTIEWETPEAPVEEEPEPAPIHPDEAHAVLTGVLDTLGAAHHRPFSRP